MTDGTHLIGDTEVIHRLTRDPRRMRRWLWLVWTLPGVLQAAQTWLFHDHGLTLRLLAFSLPVWWPWIPATPWVLRLTERVPVTDGGRTHPGHALMHLGMSVVLAALHMVFFLGWLRLWSPFHQGQGTETLWHDFVFVLTQPVFMASLATYWLVACSQLIVGFSGRLHERDMQETRILGRLAEAEERSLRMQMQPESLARSLEELSATVRRGELEDAEAAIDELAGKLRETLRHGDNLPEVWSNPDYDRKSRRY